MTTVSSQQTVADYARFAIGFDPRDRGRLHALIDEVIDSGHWSEGEMTSALRGRLGRPTTGAEAVAIDGWTGGALAALNFAQVQGETVLCPSNTFMATPLAAINAGASVQFVDCNREDLCMSFKDFEAKAEKHKPRAAFLVHIGGHIAFDTVRDRGVLRGERDLPDRRLRPRPRRRMEWAQAGHLRRRRRLLAVRDQDDHDRRGRGARLQTRPEVIEHARAFRNYGKPTYEVQGLNFRMSEFTAALGLIRDRALARDRGLEERDRQTRARPGQYPSRLELPEGMTSGLYKYIVLDWLERSTGRVYDEPCHRVMGHQVDLPNTDWVARNHSCVPLYYRPET